MKRKAIRRQVNKYLRQPVATLDLHGCSRREAEEELTHFIHYWLEQGGGVKLLIITGQGWHSPDGQGIIKPFTINWLKEHGYRYRFAKPQDGGSGALEVDLPIN
ncbi:Smr/MutS family protein [Patescibacteria group bacterium]|jgi:DNA-nicking Smr family endonuclease|nr:Smr/MutS family protein [Patescibacteria group bacterium]